MATTLLGLFAGTRAIVIEGGQSQSSVGSVYTTRTAPQRVDPNCHNGTVDGRRRLFFPCSP